MQITPLKREVFVRTASGEEFKLGVITELSIEEPIPEIDDPYLCITQMPEMTGTFVVTADFMKQPKVKLKLFGLTNNYIRLHGGKPMRRIQKRFMK